MKHTIKTLLIASALTLPIAAYAGHHQEGHGDHQHHEKMQQQDAVMGRDDEHQMVLIVLVQRL